MNIYLTKSAEEAHTKISAFDAALRKMGVADYNLIILSSIIPPKTEIVLVESYEAPKEDYGNKLYCVRADIRSEKKGEVIGAALGYYQHSDGRGVFVEHERTGNSVEEVENALQEACRDSVTDLCEGRGVAVKREDVQYLTSVTTVKDKPACALVVAVYQSEAWR